MSEFKKIVDGVYMKTYPIEPEIVKISEIDIEINKLNIEIDNYNEPTDEDLIQFAKSMHPYYANKDTLIGKRDELIELKNYLNTL